MQKFLKMKIIHVVISVGSRGGGVSTLVRSLILQQIKNGHQPVVVSSPFSQGDFKRWCALENIQVPYHVIERCRLRRMTVLGGLSNKNYQMLIKKYGEENVVFHFHNPIGVGIFGKIPSNSICTIHSFIGRIFSSKITNLLATLSFKRLKKQNIITVACCRVMENYLREKYGLKRTTTILNGISDIEKAENKYVSVSEKIHIGYAAVLNELKGWHILAQAYELLPLSVRKKCDLTFVGRVDPVDQEKFNAFLERNNEVKYWGFLPNAAGNFIPYLDIFVLPSRSEGFPMSLLETMQHGVVPIATAVGGIPELIEDNKSGFLVERTPKALAQCLEELIVDPEKLLRVKQQAKQRFKKIGTAEQMTQDYLKVYMNTINRSARE